MKRCWPAADFRIHNCFGQAIRRSRSGSSLHLAVHVVLIHAVDRDLALGCRARGSATASRHRVAQRVRMSSIGRSRSCWRALVIAAASGCTPADRNSQVPPGIELRCLIALRNSLSFSGCRNCVPIASAGSRLSLIEVASGAAHSRRSSLSTPGWLWNRCI